MTRRQGRALLILALLVLMVNLPLILSWTTQSRITSNGVDVTATVIGTRAGGTPEDPSYAVTFRLPVEIDPDQVARGARVTAAAFDTAEDTGAVTVRVLENRPTAFRVEGQVTSRAGLWATVVADLLLAGLVVLLWRSGRYGRSSGLVLEATADLEHDPAGEPGVLDVEGGELVRGWVGEASADEVLLDLPDRNVVVVLDGHANPVPLGELARARGRVLE